MMKLKIIFTLLDLHMFHSHFNHTCNEVVINYHLVTLSEMVYIHILDRQNNGSMLRYVKEKICDCVDKDSCYS